MGKMYLLDTNIISEFTKLNPDKKVMNLYEIRKRVTAISAVTWQEMTYGIERMPEGRKKRTLSAFAAQLECNTEIIPYDESAAFLCGRLQSQCEKAGKPLPYNDAQIAATAMSRGMVLVTHNTADFSELVENFFLKMEDWFEA